MKTTMLITPLAVLLLGQGTTNAQTRGATNDLWDVSQGVAVLSHSPLADYDWIHPPQPFDARAMFGATFPNLPLEPDDAIFRDGNPAGFVHFVEWRTAAPITLRSFDLYARGDYPVSHSREFASFTLRAKSPGSSTFDLVIYSHTPPHPYPLNASSVYLVSSDITPVTAQEFRAEFVNRTAPYDGPRIIEMDGFGEHRARFTLTRGATNDLWDVSQGVAVLSHSPLANYYDDPSKPFDARAMFGATFPNIPFAPDEAIFRDRNPAGFVHFVEWRTVAPITLRSFDLYADGDYPVSNSREFASFTLRAKSPGSSTFDLVLYSHTPPHPYPINAYNVYLVSADIAPVTAQEFRAEFVNRTAPYDGPRIVEMDGFVEHRIWYAQTRGVTNDLWDVSQGVAVFSHSPLANYWDDPSKPFDARAMFGATFPDYPLEWDDAIFRDGNPADFVHFVEWRTVAPITLRSFDLYARGDYPTSNSREFASFTLRAKSPGANTFDLVLYSHTPPHPYPVNAFSVYRVSADIAPVTAQEFRAEFVNRTAPYDGPRIIEMDGFGEHRIRTSIEVSCVDICWTSVTSVLYQVQYRSDLTTNQWADLGAPVLGTGRTQCLTESIRGTPRRFYRVVEVP